MNCPKHGNIEEIDRIVARMKEAIEQDKVLPFDEIWPNGLFPDCFSLTAKESLPCTCGGKP